MNSKEEAIDTMKWMTFQTIKISMIKMKIDSMKLKAAISTANKKINSKTLQMVTQK